MAATMSQTVVNDKGMRTDISVLGQNGYIICTPTEGWMYFPFAGQTEPQALPVEQVKLSQDRLNYSNQLLVNKAFIVKSSLEGTDTINSASCYKLKITCKDGNEETCYIDTKTYFLVKTEAKVSIQGDDQDLAVSYSDFKKQPEGVTIPMSMSSPQGDVSFNSVEFNKVTDDKIFKPDTTK